MSGSAAMAPQINLDEFERRLRAAGSPVGPQEDPLEELARLVGLDTPEPKPQPKILGFAPRGEAPRLPPVNALHVDEGTQTAPAIMMDAPLRGALEDSPQDFDPQHFRQQGPTAPAAEIDDETVASADEAARAPRRSGRALATMGVLVVVGAAGLVGAWVVKGAPGLPKTPPLIMAANGPTKIQPPTDDTIASPSDSASVLLKDQKGKTEPVKLVSSEEQPVDLAQQAKAQPAPTPAPAPAIAVASAAPAPATAPPASSSTTAAPLAAASAMPMPSPAAAPAPVAPSNALSPTRSIALTSLSATNAAPAAPAPFPEPKRVKTVSVRPDGSVISTGSEAVADARPAADPASAPANTGPSVAPSDDAAAQPAHPPVPHVRPSLDAAAQPATPKLDLPTKLSPKSTRAPTPKIDTTVASGAGQSPETLRAQQQAQQQPQPQKTPLQIVPDLIQSVTKAVSGEPQQPQQVASADPVATATTGSGAYAVQLAAPATDREAQSAASRLRAKYAGELGGMQPTIHQAEVNGRSIYRVRVSGMARADAVSLCQKLKASGGDCFVARD
jgi:SPOR domain